MKLVITKIGDEAYQLYGPDNQEIPNMLIKVEKKSISEIKDQFEQCLEHKIKLKKLLQDTMSRR
jgi:hypothetical protein